MNFKVGDKVRVRKDLKQGDNFSRYVNDDMEKLAGEVVTIKFVGSTSYKLEEDNWSWTDDMLLKRAVKKAPGSGIYFDEIEGFSEIKESTHVEIKKQTQITVKDKELSLVYTTNTRKNRVSMHLNGQKQTRIRFQDIDRVIELLTRLKSEV